MKARFLRWCHLMKQFFLLQPHQAVTYTVNRITRVGCTCGEEW